MKCVKCGAEVQNGANFCPECGMFLTCHICKRPVQFGAMFCGECGASMNNRSVPLEKVVEQRPVKKKSNTGCIIVAVVLLLALILALVAGIFSFMYFIGALKDRNNTEVLPTEASYEEVTEEVIEVDPWGEEVVVEEDYLFPSDTEYITRWDLNGKTQEEVAFIRNEIYARHGYIFKNEVYQEYFGSKSWYRPNPYFSESDFNSIEKANKEFLVEYEESRGWR